MPLSRYLISFPDPGRPGSAILYSTRKGSMVRVPEGVLAAARAGSLAEAERDLLRRLNIWTDDPAAERRAMAGLVDHTNQRSATFSATVLLTLDCNLACPYCFEGHFRANRVMTAETARLLIGHVQREHIDQGRDVEIRFYGGEPLMAVPLLKEIARSLWDAATAAGTRFSCSLVTNGTLLTRSTVEELLPLGLHSAQITLDGPLKVHDRQRPFVSGKGSFGTILNNLQAVYDLITLKPGGNYTRENYRQFPAMLDALLDAGMDPARLGPVQFAPVHPKSGGHDAHSAACFAGDEPWLMEASLFLREETLRRGFSVDKPQMGVCMVELANTLVVNWDGTLYKCPPLMGWPELSIGTLAGGINDYRASHDLDMWKNDECLECAYLPLCFGGCRFFRKLKTGAVDGVDCRRGYLDEALERLVLQDLELQPRP